jgi:cell wall assembly regulator SMI1
MNQHVRYASSNNPDPACADLMTTAERELSAFFNAVSELFGSEQAKLSAEDWLHELMKIDGVPASIRDWRMLAAKASTRLATRVTFDASTSSLSPSLSSSLSTSLSTEPQIA